jgi:hypothetical protein
VRHFCWLRTLDLPLDLPRPIAQARQVGGVR